MNKRKYTEDGGIKVAQDPSVFYNSSDPQQILSYVTDPCPFDVLLGRGLLVNNFTGNVFYRNLIASRRIEYSSTQKRQRKHEIALQILDVICNEKGGRFLRELKTSAERAQVGYVLPLSQTTNRSELSGAWIVVDERTCTKKIKHALRDPDSSSIILETSSSARHMNHLLHEQIQDHSMPLTCITSLEQYNLVPQFSNNRLHQNQTLIPTQLVNGGVGILQSGDHTPLLSYQQSASEQNVASGALARNNMTKTLLSPNQERAIEKMHPKTKQAQNMDFRSHIARNSGYERYRTASALLQQLRQQHETIIHQRLAFQNHYQGSAISPTGLSANPGVLSLPQQMQWHLLQGPNMYIGNQPSTLLTDATASTITQSRTNI